MANFMDQFVLLNNKEGFHGPMVHKETGESYQAMSARLEHEYQQRKKDELRNKPTSGDRL